jgi:alkanesulfonate monooxygenase SsuD/methylene tetrahydromethanopterin reductase-like flavin-dependent oxidoreductase (luciferase family)
LATTETEGVSAGRKLLSAGNRLKLGLFDFNGSNGLSLKMAPNTLEASWDHTLALARRADDMGLELLIPIARWRGLSGEGDPFATSVDTMTWTAGIAAATEQINMVSTLHLPLMHPITAANQGIAVDHIARGRYAFNGVIGWYAPDVVMFGGAMREHDARHRYGAEWLEIVKRIWTEREPFDFAGDHFQLAEVRALPKPWQKPYPLLLNAGNSSAGMDLAAREADINFAHESLEAGAEYVTRARSHARERYNRDLKLLGIGFVVCRKSEAEARQVVDHMLVRGDHTAARSHLTEFGLGSESLSEQILRARARRRQSSARAPTSSSVRPNGWRTDSPRCRASDRTA